MRTLVLSLAVALSLLPATAPAAHPVVEAFGLSGAELPPHVHLVRTRGDLPAGLDLQVLARREGALLVSGSPPAFAELARRGLPVRRVDPSVPVPVGPARTWTPVAAADPRIQERVDAVDWPILRARIHKLVNLGTRHSIAPQNAAAADTLAVFFERRGLAVEYHPFALQELTRHNVIATQPGTVHPDTIVVVSAHFDCLSEWPLTDAPGADDNATGVTAVQTVADLLSGMEFEYTIQYVCFNAEEQQMVGSQAWCAEMRARGVPILAALDFDMIGYWSHKTPMDFDLEIESNQASQWLLEAVTNAADLYTTMSYEAHVFDGAWWGDHASFWAQGYAALNHEEAWDWGDPDFNPAYHTSGDVLTLIDEDFMVGNTKVAVAAVATLARPVGSVPVRPVSVGGLKSRFRGNRPRPDELH